MPLKRLLIVGFAVLVLTAAALSQTFPPGVQKVTSVEGITEYAFPNGLHVLLFPDNSKPKITVNVTYLVGSRHEAYGETGMAHLLEHMVFKTAKSGRDIWKELTDHGAQSNGSTDYDRTNYFETFNAGDDNLRWALALEADRMVNMTMLKKDLDSEMTVVRNEMEMGENSPMNVLQERILHAAYTFHNYGKTVIGARSDVERVPIERLAVFYEKYYQPDNAVLTIAGQIDETKTLQLVMQTLGAIPRPQRTLPQPYTVEPTQDGERFVTLRRVGDNQAVMGVYHIPAAMHPDGAPLDVLAQVLGAPQTGRLYKALVDGKKAVSSGASASSMHDPGFFFIYAQLRQDQSIDEARDLLVKTVEGVVTDPPNQEEVDRAKTRILKNTELMLTNSQTIGLYMSEYAAAGDWRLLFLSRDEIKNGTPADVSRVAKAYLKSSNRTLGEFIPTKTPDRADVPATPEVSARLKDFKGGESIQQGEAFDPTPRNIESRTTRVTLPNGLKLVMLPKKTRGAAVVALLNVRFGDEKSLFGKSAAGTFAGALLMRGTKNKNRQQIQDETDRLKAQIGVNGGVNGASANVRTLEANLEGSLRFVRELLREPSFPEAELEQLRQQRIASIESGRSEPTSLASREMSRHLTARYRRGDVRYTPTLDEDLEDVKKVTIEDVRNFYTQFYGVGEGEIAIVGQFDPARIQKLVTELFGDWKSPARYERIANPYEKVETINRKIETPDKQNAIFLAAMPFKMSDDDPDLAALTLVTPVFGSGANSRILQRIRIKEGLSYGASAGFSVPTKDDRGLLSANAIAAPQNMPKLESIFNEEVAKALKDGFTPDEVEKAKKAWLEQRLVSRSEDTSLASLLVSRERWGRTLSWDEKLESAVGALTP
ncbi:MAG: insulinase family protein [Acidobacteriia bacterium]|nr:insulinase family protein [Terriglobia bacterium]